jgi:hypothetical protein
MGRSSASRRRKAGNDVGLDEREVVQIMRVFFVCQITRDLSEGVTRSFSFKRTSASPCRKGVMALAKRADVALETVPPFAYSEREAHRGQNQANAKT